jgi:ADP-ribose pyrophosphatase YjhB (NUDIX family)
VSVILLNKEKTHILLAKRASFLVHGGKYALPGGFAARDETLIEGAKRETLEETGYACRDIILFRINDNPHRHNEDRQTVDFIYRAMA